MKTRITLFAFILNILCFSLDAATATWIGPATGGDWYSAANWSTLAIPEPTDSVSIPAGFTVTASDDVGTINRLHVAGKLIIDISGTLIVNQTESPNNFGIVTLAGGEIENNGLFSVINSVATSSNTVIEFADNADRDNKFTNIGIFMLDNTQGGYGSTLGKAIGVSMVSPDRTSTLKFGGVMDFRIKTGCCFIESNSGGILTLDGTLVMGSSSDYKNLRFIKIQGGSGVTIAPTADITVYSGFINSNGVINMQSSRTTEPGASFKNYGKLIIHGGAATTGYGIYFNPGATGTIHKFINAGTLSLDGIFPSGFFFLGGAFDTNTTVHNTSTGIFSLYSTSPTLQVIRTSNALTQASIINDGVINVSSPSISYSSTLVTLTNNGTINYNYIAGNKELFDFSGKVFYNGNEIIINMPTNENVNLILTDITGRTLQTATLQGERNSISINSLKGIYIVRLLTSKGSYSQKISID